MPRKGLSPPKRSLTCRTRIESCAASPPLAEPPPGLISLTSLPLCPSFNFPPALLFRLLSHPVPPSFPSLASTLIRASSLGERAARSIFCLRCGNPKRNDVVHWLLSILIFHSSHPYRGVLNLDRVRLGASDPIRDVLDASLCWILLLT